VASRAVSPAWPIKFNWPIFRNFGLNLNLSRHFVLRDRRSGIGKSTEYRWSGEGGVDIRILPWVSATFACSHYALINFYRFWGGETGLMALLPWIVLIAWKLRSRPILSFLFLPWAFLLGSFIKHAFAIHSICIILFLFLETSRHTPNLSDKKTEVVLRTISKAFPLVAIGFVYIFLRYHFITRESPSPTNPTIGEDLFNLPTYLGYSAWGPLLAPWGMGTLIDMYAPRFLNLNVRVWEYLGPLLSLLSPVAIGFYIWLSFGKTPLTRLAGITALVTSGIHFYIYHSGGVIELRDRYYQFPAFLFLAVAAMQVLQSEWRRSVARLVLGGAILIGTGNLIRGVRANRSWEYRVPKMEVSSHIPNAVIEEIYTLVSNSEDSIIVSPTPILRPHLNASLSPSIRFVAFDKREGPVYESISGRVPLIVSAHLTAWPSPPIALFKDYSEDEWETYEIQTWTIQRAINK